jgi:hypothetical protein
LFKGAVSVYIVNDGMISEYGAGCGMKMGRGKRSIRRKPAPIKLCDHTATINLTGRDLESNLSRGGGKECCNSGSIPEG